MTMRTDEPSEDDEELFAAFDAGTALELDEAAALCAALEKDPDDVRLRARLAGMSSRLWRAGEVEIALANALWWIAHRPASFVASRVHVARNAPAEVHARLDAAWEQAIAANPTDPGTLMNAARAFELDADVNRAKELLLAARAAAPEDFMPEFQLAKLLEREGRRAHDTGQMRAALAHHEVALSKSAKECWYWSQTIVVCKAALDAGVPERARALVQQFLEFAKREPRIWEDGQILHDANIVLGRLALLDGDVETAKKQLLEAGRSRGSASLGSFGPNMVLAQELLQRGERTVVIEYLERCRTFWKRGGDRLDEWIAAVERAEPPDFGANLSY